MKIKCSKCETLKGASKDRYNKLVEKNSIETYLCRECRKNV